MNPIITTFILLLLIICTLSQEPPVWHGGAPAQNSGPTITHCEGTDAPRCVCKMDVILAVLNEMVYALN